MVSDYGNGVGHSLNILTPLSKGENDGKKFPVIDIIVLFSGKEGVREICTGMEVAIGIAL